MERNRRPHEVALPSNEDPEQDLFVLGMSTAQEKASHDP
jgi:hypothetical protein